jgi:hypothetical protein
MKYVGISQDESELDTCEGCAFDDHTPLQPYCRQVVCKDLQGYVPIEVQHIPHLRKVGKTKWQN